MADWRIFLEAFRGDSWIMAGGLRGAQPAGLAVLVLYLAGRPRLARQTLAPEAALSDTTQAAGVRQEEHVHESSSALAADRECCAGRLRHDPGHD
jgi:hypothetical protein